MFYQVRPSWYRVLHVVALTTAVVAAPLPCLAGEPSSPVQSKLTLNASMQKAVALEARAERGAPPARAVQSGGGKTDLGSKSFFKTPAGVITLIALGAGVGYALYSTSHDRVKSPNVPYGGSK